MAATATVPAHLPPVIERASATDRAILAMDVGDVPEQLAVILVLEQAGGLDVQRVRGLIAGRLPTIPRLRQRLVLVALGCGGPVWADDPRFDIGRHVRAMRCPGPGEVSRRTARSWVRGMDRPRGRSRTAHTRAAKRHPKTTAVAATVEVPLP